MIAEVHRKISVITLSSSLLKEGTSLEIEKENFCYYNYREHIHKNKFERKL